MNRLHFGGLGRALKHCIAEDVSRSRPLVSTRKRSGFLKRKRCSCSYSPGIYREKAAVVRWEARRRDQTLKPKHGRVTTRSGARGVEMSGVSLPEPRNLFILLDLFDPELGLLVEVHVINSAQFHYLVCTIVRRNLPGRSTGGTTRVRCSARLCTSDFARVVGSASLLEKIGRDYVWHNGRTVTTPTTMMKWLSRAYLTCCCAACHALFSASRSILGVSLTAS